MLQKTTNLLTYTELKTIKKILLHDYVIGIVQHVHNRSMDLIEKSISRNREMFEQAFHYPANKDIVFRDFKFRDKEGFVIYIDGMSSGDKISDFILRPLLNNKNPSADIESILHVSSIAAETDFNEAILAILQGDCVLCIDDNANAYICETKGFDKRGVEKPQVENSIVGSQEAFTETLRTNTTQLHRIIKNQGLTTEMVTVGKINQLSCGVVFVQGIANTEFVEEVKRRLKGIDTDFVQNGGMIEQFIEDRSFSLFPTVTTTERPDNVAALLMQGRIAIIVDGSPRVIVVPITLFSILKTSEESALRIPLASVVRAIRLLAVYAALLAPALYLAITTFHPNMLPTGLAISIAKSRVNIPYPALFELLIMEISFELIREAGERIPGLLGSTIGIVGGLILGEAAVSAGLVSQGCVVIIAFTALGNFAIPQYQLSITARILRIIFLLCAGLFGFLGISLAFIILAGYLNAMTSFGIDFVNPLFSGNTRMFPKQPVWEYENRPPSLCTGKPEYQPRISRLWKRPADQ